MFIQMRNNKNKRGQEEMVGFALIIVIVAVILLIFVGFSLTRKTEAVESYEVESFIQAMMQQTSDCRDNLERLDVQSLILRCRSNGKCIDDRNTCDVLKETLEEIMAESWKIGNTPVIGYNLSITIENEIVMSISEGNKTINYKGSFQKLQHDIDILLNIYY